MRAVGAQVALEVAALHEFDRERNVLNEVDQEPIRGIVRGGDLARLL